MQFTRTLSAGLAAFFVLTSLVQAQPAPLRTAWLGEFEAFAAWYAHERQWDRENNLAVELKVFPTGKLMVDNVRAYDWNVAACGGVPAIRAMLRKDVYVVAVGTDEAAANAVYARPDSPLHRTMPVRDVAEYLRGKTLLCPLGTSAHQFLLAWLDHIGLKDTDVIIVDTKPEDAVKALAEGMGELAALWAPATYEAEKRGLLQVGRGQREIAQPVLIIAERGYADKHPEQVKAFLRGYLKAVDYFRTAPEEELVPLYQRFQKEFAGNEMSAENAREDLETHPLFSLEKQKELFGPAPPAKAAAMGAPKPQGELRARLKDVIAFHEKTGALSHREARELEALPLVTPRFLP